MKRNFVSATAASLALIAMLLATPALAEQTIDQNRQRPLQREVHRRSLDNQHAQHHMVVRASEIIGHNIVNSKNESVGEINDLVLDPKSGRVRYAAVTYGGFMGIGDEMFAVPWEAFQCRQNADDHDEHVVILDVSKQQLDGAEGFDQDNWPNFADQEFTTQIDRRYGVQRSNDHDGVGVNIHRNGVDVDVDRN